MSVGTGAENTDVARVRAPNTLDGDQQVIEQAAPSATFVASPTFKEDGAADDGTLPGRWVLEL